MEKFENDSCFEIEVREDAVLLVKIKETACGEIVVPEGVTHIGRMKGEITSEPISESSKIESIRLPETLVSIDDCVFVSMRSLKSIDIPDSVCSIGAKAFEDTGLKRITLPKNLKEIAPDTFAGCSDLEDVVLNNGLEEIQAGAFAGCDKLRTIDFPSSIKIIDEFAFDGCGLKQVEIPPSVKFIGYRAFDCDVSTIRMPYVNSDGINDFIDGINDFIDDCDDNRELLNNAPRRTLVLPSSFIVDQCIRVCGLPIEYEDELDSEGLWYDRNFIVEEQGDLYSRGEKQLCLCLTKDDSYTVREGVEYIVDEAFKFCKSLKTIELPSSLRDLSDDTFYGCDSLEAIIVPDDLIYKYVLRDFWDCYLLGLIASKNVTTESKPSLTIQVKKSDVIKRRIEIPQCVDTLSVRFKRFTARQIACLQSMLDVANVDYDECGRVQSISFPEFVMRISMQDSLCNSVNIELPCAFNVLPEGAFEDCWFINKVVIPDSITKLPDSAFANCGTIDIVLPPTLSYISHSAFEGCQLCADKIKELILTRVVKLNPDAFEGIEIESLELSGYVNLAKRGFAKTRIKRLTLVGDIPSISRDYMKQFSNVEELDVQYRFATSEPGTFHGLRNIRRISIPDSVTGISDEAFFGCFILSEMKIPESLETIGKYAFQSSGLESIIIPSSVKKIEEGAFADTDLKQIKLPESLADISRGMFYRCCSLTDVHIPDSVEVIGIGAFAKCTSLQSVIIPPSVTKIEASAFVNCNALAEVVIPDSVVSIGDKAFAECNALTSVKLPLRITELSESAFARLDSLQRRCRTYIISKSAGVNTIEMIKQILNKCDANHILEVVD